MSSTSRASFAEFVGTFLFVLVGASVSIIAVVTQQSSSIGILEVALAHGLMIAVLISTFGRISGGHFNPAVTLGLAAAGRAKFTRALAFVVAQLAGAAAAALVVQRMFEGFFKVFQESQGPQAAEFIDNLSLGAPTLGPFGTSVGTGILVEAVFTFLLVLVIWGTCIDRRAGRTGGFAVGLTVTVGILVASLFTGGAFNPARHFGPALVSGNWGDWWVYWIGPLLGSAAASLLWTGAFARELDSDELEHIEEDVDSWDEDDVPAHAMLGDSETALGHSHDTETAPGGGRAVDPIQTGAMISEGGPATEPPPVTSEPPPVTSDAPPADPESRPVVPQADGESSDER